MSCWSRTVNATSNEPVLRISTLIMNRPLGDNCTIGVMESRAIRSLPTFSQHNLDSTEIKLWFFFFLNLFIKFREHQGSILKFFTLSLMRDTKTICSNLMLYHDYRLFLMHSHHTLVVNRLVQKSLPCTAGLLLTPAFLLFLSLIPRRQAYLHHLLYD